MRITIISNMKFSIAFSCFLLFTFFGKAQPALQVMDIAFEHLDRGNLDSGLVYINRAIELDSTYYLFHYNRGVIHRELGKLDLAIADFTRAIKWNPLDTSSFMNRGILYSRLGDFDRALYDYNNVLRMDSTKKEAYLNIGINALNAKDLLRAEIMFKKCMELDPDYHSAIFRLGKTYLFSRRFDEAYSHFNRSISLYDQDPEYFECRGIMNFMKGDQAAGCKDFLKVQELGELSPPALEIQRKECP